MGLCYSYLTWYLFRNRGLPDKEWLDVYTMRAMTPEYERETRRFMAARLGMGVN